MKFSSTTKCLLWLACALLLSNAHGFAQTRTSNQATLQITVLDPSGAAIPQAQVQVITAPTGAKKSAPKTNARGEVTFNQFVAGVYQLQISAPGFTPRTINDVRLQPGGNQL